MESGVRVKICGVKDSGSIAAAAAAGAAYIGFNFFGKSPRYVSPREAAALAADVPAGICKVALTVDADDATLEALIETVPLDMLQLHGSETPARVADLQNRFRLPVMKAVGVEDESDLPKLDSYLRVADQILVDAKPPVGAALPGGNGLTFDWRLIAGRRWPCPWMLAGGLTPENVGEAIRLTGVRQVDVSSGVESAPGTKDTYKIRSFIAAAQV